MRKLLLILVAVVAVGVLASSTQAAPFYQLKEWALNIDGTIYDSLDGDSFPGVVNAAGFNAATGLGTLTVTLEAGSHNILLFLDHDINEPTNSYFNETGTAVGAPSAGQYWEIDEPGYVFGDIYDNFLNGTLDNTNAVPPSAPDDVSMAIGWNFSAADQTILTFLLSNAAPTSGLYLMQSDPGGGEADPGNIYFSSTLGGGGEVPVPEPATLLLTGSGLGALALLRKRMKR
jgi:hypothetical protein